MLLPVGLETPTGTENCTAAAVPNALYALQRATLLLTARAIWGGFTIAGRAVYARHSLESRSYNTGCFPLTHAPLPAKCAAAERRRQ